MSPEQRVAQGLKDPVEGEAPKLSEEGRALVIAGLAKGKKSITSISTRDDLAVPISRSLSTGRFHGIAVWVGSTVHFVGI